MLSRLLIAAFMSPALLTRVGDFHYICVTFPRGILDQVWYLIVSFPDLCHLSYLNLCVLCIKLAQNTKQFRRLVLV